MTGVIGEAEVKVEGEAADGPVADDDDDPPNPAIAIGLGIPEPVPEYENECAWWCGAYPCACTLAFAFAEYP